MAQHWPKICSEGARGTSLVAGRKATGVVYWRIDQGRLSRGGSHRIGLGGKAESHRIGKDSLENFIDDVLSSVR
jgi:hypothetical protein